MTKLINLNREQKILLFKEIAAGNVKRESLNDDTFIGIEPSDGFLGLIMAATALKVTAKVSLTLSASGQHGLRKRSYRN